MTSGRSHPALSCQLTRHSRLAGGPECGLIKWVGWTRRRGRLSRATAVRLVPGPDRRDGPPAPPSHDKADGCSPDAGSRLGIMPGQRAVDRGLEIDNRKEAAAATCHFQDVATPFPRMFSLVSSNRVTVRVWLEAA